MFVSLEAGGKIGKRCPARVILSGKKGSFCFYFFQGNSELSARSALSLWHDTRQIKEGTEDQIPQDFQGLKCDRVYSQCTPSLSNFLIQCLKRNSCHVARPQISRNKRTFCMQAFCYAVILTESTSRTVYSAAQKEQVTCQKFSGLSGFF